MSLFSSIVNKIFGRANAGTPAAEAPPADEAAATPAPGAPAAAPAAPATAAAEPVDVEAVLTEAASRNPQNLNWRTSIVDLLKLLDLDSSLAARKELAKELSYNGDLNDSATMNIWLHKHVMRKLAENGGKVPADLRD